jgi:tRNA-2-methylthio-N6-dimethylallyladenosine synthase
VRRRYFIETYGCQMNKAESAAVETLFRDRGWSASENGEDADLVLINTCSVRTTAETRALGRLDLYAARKRERDFTLVVTGCMAERMKDGLKADKPAVDYVVGAFSKSSLGPIIDSVGMDPAANRPVEIDESPSFVFAPSHLEPGAFRSYLPIMHGCDNYCSYCIVPYVRGRETSRPRAEILRELSAMASSGVREVSLLGQNVNSYSSPEEGGRLDFAGLLSSVSEELAAYEARGQGSLRWVRFLSSHPKDLGEPIIEAMARSPYLCRHIHLCVQHGSDRILEAMNRRYTARAYLDLVGRLRAAMPGISLSTDILVGFPGETEADVEATLALMREVGFEYSFMYYFNPREGTKAATMGGQIPLALRKERLARVIALQSGLSREAMNRRLGTECEVLVESVSRRSELEILGRNQQDEMVVLPGKAEEKGSFVRVRLASLKGNTFRAERIS